jgi:hypothetical protein
MTRARIANRHGSLREYDLVNYTDNGETVLRDDHGDVLILVESEFEWVELCCHRLRTFRPARRIWYRPRDLF